MSHRVQETIAAVWRIESPKLIARLARMTRDVGRAEDLAADAFVAALAQWPSEGIPRTPGAWLMTAAKRRLIDSVRREKRLAEKTERRQNQLPYDGAEPDFAATYEDIQDDMLRLMFVACHPVLSPEARVALTLKLLGGLTTAEIARAYLSSEATVAQRIVRAKRALSETRVSFEVPEGQERVQRLAPVLEALYLIFNEGYAATAGHDVLRPELVEDALRLGRILARLMPHEAEVHGLVALMEIQASRIPARVASDGSAILLLDQDRGKWNHLLIQRGLGALARAERLGAPGPYALQASIAACHARAATPGGTDWQRIVALYDAFAVIMPSPVVELNRGVAVGMAYGPDAALAIVDALLDEPSLHAYHLLPGVRGDLLFKIGRLGEARLEFERALALAANGRDRAFFQKRADECRNA
ncbi:MAG TPA: RNA polymerase sigma factor [Candidatus Cybelea sp.]|nr:RNA polymerase sigma factor [Candidatus Cybelea sp.]